MSLHNNPRVEQQEDLLFYIDAQNHKSMSGAGAGGFASHDEGLTDLVDKTRKAKFAGDAKAWGKLKHWTMVGISYPEGNYGGSWAGRDGLMQGYNASSGTKTFDFTRDLHIYAWDPHAAGWVSDSFFNGERLYGHCYDNYENASTELEKAFDDTTAVLKAFPDAIFLFCGSHANEWSNSYWDSTGMTQRLMDLGAPAAIDSWSGWKEWCMLGGKGLGTGNAYSFIAENGTGQDAAQVGHMNFRLPRFATKKKGIYSGDIAVDFDGTGDYLDLGSDITFKSAGGWTVEAWVRPEAVSSGPYNIIGSETISHNSWYWSILSSKLAMWDLSPGNVWKYGNTTLSTGRWYHTVLVSDPNNTSYYIYLNGENDMSSAWSSYNGSWNSSKAGLMVRSIGRSSAANSRYWDGQISSVKFYNRALSAKEVKRSYKMMKKKVNPDIGGSFY
jgi:hypothetical protein